MSAADWYARKLGQAPQQPQRPSTPPTGPVGYQPPTVYQPPYQPANPQQGMYQAPQQAAPGPPTLGDKDSIHDAILHRPDVWQGRGPSVKAKETYNCPNCGSPHFFTRQGMGSKTTKNGVMPPAPMCDSCGYNGLWEQTGSQDIPEGTPYG